jgi:TonB family protein
MKQSAGPVKSRRTAVSKKNVRLDLKRRPPPPSEEDLLFEKKSSFWKWVAFVALLHVLVIAIVSLVYELTPAPKPPQEFVSLLPQGDVVKGTAGTQAAKKVGATTPAPSVVHHASSPTSATAVHPPKPVTPKPKPIPPKPALKMDAPTLMPIKPVPPAPVTPPKPTPPKVKVDLTLADGPTTPDKPKPKVHKKPVTKPDNSDDDNDATTKSTSSGLSKEQIAQKLGDKADAAGVKDAIKTGISGSVDAHPNNFSDFYASIRDQVMSQWQSPNLADETAVNPVVQIHVEKDGHVPPEMVHLVQSSGNPSYDDSAVAAARNLGYLHEPLPEGCPPDIPITFKLTR